MAGKIQAAAAAVKTEGPTLTAYIKSMKGEVEKALPTVMTPERFTRIVLSAINSTPALADCTPASFLAAMMSAAQLGLEPNTPLGQAYLIPYNNYKKGVTECQFQLGYKGLIDLAYRSGDVTLVQAHVVKENDEFDYELGLKPKLVHKPAKTNRGKSIYYYAMFETKNGGYGFECMSIEDIRESELQNRKGNKGMSNIWEKHFDAMAKKTVLKQALKYAPMKSEFIRGIVQDGTIRNEIANDMSEVEAEYTIDEDGVITETTETPVITKPTELTEAEKQAILQMEMKEAVNEKM
jgi:recombination protein RecT